MKKLFIFLAISATIAFCAGTSLAQQKNHPSGADDGFQIDSYPTPEQMDPNRVLLLLKSEPDIWLPEKKVLIGVFRRSPYFDQGILLPPMNWNCDPGILLYPKNYNCDPGMIIWSQSDREIPKPSSTFDSNMLPSFLPNTLLTPFLSPGADPFRKMEELREAGKLTLPEFYGIGTINK